MIGGDFIVSDAIKNTDIYKTIAASGLSAISASDVYNAIQAIGSFDGDDIVEYTNFLIALWQLVEMNSSGLRTEANSATSQDYMEIGLYSDQRAKFTPLTAGGSLNAILNARKRLAVLDITLSNGAASNQELVAAVSGLCCQAGKS